MELKKLSKRARVMWYIRNAVLLALISCFAGCAVLIIEFLPAVIIVCALWAALAVSLLIWPSLTYKKYSYGYDDKRFYIECGVIFKHRITVPICQIQDMHFYEGPVMQLFKTGKVIFATAGSNFEISGLDREVALKLVEEVEDLLRKRIEVNTNEEI